MGDHLGGMSLAEIEVAAREQPFPEDAGASPSSRFVMRISSLVTIRHEKGERGGVAVFLRSDALQSDAEGCNGTFHPVLATGNDPITDRVWLSNAVLGGAYALDVDCTEQSQMFGAISASGFGSLPALVIDWRGEIPAGRFYGRGLNDLDHVQDVVLAYTEITPDDLKDCLDNFHKTSLETPQRVREGHGEAIWTDASKGLPGHRPEERVHAKLIEHLRSRYTKHKVRSELKNPDGITDLLIFAHTKDVAGEKVIVNEWVLELKALTDKTENGGVVGLSEARKRIVEGLTQAIAFRDKEHARKAALCCYDMRSTDETDEICFAQIKGEAQDQAVFLWRWFLFRSTQALRDAERATRNALAAVKSQESL